MNTMSVARRLSEFLVGATAADIPATPMKHAAMLVASTLASAAGGIDIASAAIVRRLAREASGSPQATVWFDGGLKLPVGLAARVNAVASDAAASDDSDLRNIMHCGTPLVSTALAVAEYRGGSGRDIECAIVLGYETAGRMSQAIPNFRKFGFHGSLLTIFAATVAAGRLLGLDVDKMTHALALAATSTGGLSKTANTSVAREYHAGQAVMNGVQAALSAAHGFTAEEKIFEMPEGFFEVFGRADPAQADKALFLDIGSSWDIETDMAIKLVPGGHPFHALAEAAAAASRAAGVPAEQIVRIGVSRPGMTALTGPIHPEDLIDMAHSAAYFLAAGAADGTFNWSHASPEKIADPRIHSLIDRIGVDAPPEINAGRYRQGATVTIHTADSRRFSNTVYEPHGSAALGIDWADVEAKYRSLLPNAGVSPECIDRSFALIRHFDETKNVTELMRCLEAPAS